MACNQCENDLPSEGDCVTCGKCNGNYHYDCSGIKKNTWKAKSVKSRNEWECTKCRGKKNRTPSVEDDLEVDDPNIQGLKKFIENLFKRQEKIITDRVESIMVVVNQLEERFTVMLDKTKELEEKTLSLERNIEELKGTLECEKQYARSKNFIVTSIPRSETEDVPEIIVKLLQSMNITIHKEEFTAHRLPSSQNPSPIIVQCNTRATRDNIVRTARKNRPKLSLIFKNHPDRSIYFNDHLTPYFANLMAKSNAIKKSKGYRFVWMNGSKIMLKKDNLSRAIQITTEKDLDKIV